MTYYERNLPHWHPDGKTLFVTWRLWGSLPMAARSGGRDPLRSGRSDEEGPRGQECPRHRSRATSAGKRFLEMDRHLDISSRGPKWLADGRVASAVMAILGKGDRELMHYHLHAFVIMPNHVHVLVEPCIDAAKALKAIKGASARAANLILNRTGQPFWQSESYDHWVRDGAEFEGIRAYIERNPVTAGLVSEAREWRWSSARSGADTPVRADLKA